MTVINIWTYGDRECPIMKAKTFQAPYANFYKDNRPFDIDYQGYVIAQLFSVYTSFDINNLKYKIIDEDSVNNDEINLICLPIYSWAYQHKFPEILSQNQNLLEFAVQNDVKIIACYLRENLGNGYHMHLEMEKYNIYEKISPKHLSFYVNGYSNTHVTNDRFAAYVSYIDAFDKIMYEHIKTDRINIDSHFDIFRDFKHKFCFPIASLTHRPFRIEAFRLLIENGYIDRKDIFYTTTALHPDRDIDEFLNNTHKHNSYILDETKDFLNKYGLKKVFVHKVYNDKGERYGLQDANAIGNFSETPIQFLQSCIQVVFETRLHDDSITEKIYRPLFLGQPFIWHARQNLKDYLESIGYRFYPWIDYSFDKIEDPMQRLYALFDEIKRLDSIDLVMEIKKHSHVINRHNRKVFRERMIDNTEFEKFLRG